MKIYKTTDKISVKIEDVEFKISPLSYQQKVNVQSELIKAQGGNPMAIMTAARLAIKYSVKAVSGIQDVDGNQYQLEFDGTELSEACVDDLLNLDPEQRLQLVCMSLLQGKPTQPVDADGKPIKGIKIEGNDKGKK